MQLRLSTFYRTIVLHAAQWLLVLVPAEKMGQSESSFKRTYEETVCQLSSVQMGEISRRFNELYAKAGGPKGHVVDREAFSKYFNLPVAVGDRLFDAFDEKKVVQDSKHVYGYLLGRFKSGCWVWIIFFINS